MGKYSRPSQTGKILQQLLRWALIAAAAVVCVMGTVPILKSVGMGSGVNTAAGQDVSVDVALMDRYDMYMNNQVSNALDGILSIEKVFWLSDDDLIAPEPKKECFGVSNNPSELGWLLEDAQKILADNFLRFVSEKPAPVVPRQVLRYLRKQKILIRVMSMVDKTVKPDMTMVNEIAAFFRAQLK